MHLPLLWLLIHNPLNQKLSVQRLAFDTPKTAKSLRALHGCPKLTLDEDLARGAQEHAEYSAQIERLEHTNGDYGENLAFASGTCGVKLSGN
ncbi:uncharacterized protein DEA37_0002807 [Paragonimus westermani]|uniref:SCP domain-containing protein n=1 Tax=Paragonimus westermani TaxID=34504 RepID=A0A5J4NBF4_9TREM|nr:uncharacterized protein DEA37_0002807 [Paragonimus westermani]